MFSVPRDQDKGERRGTSMGPNRRQQFLVSDFGARNLPDGAVEILGIGKVDGRDVADGTAGHFLRKNLHAQSYPGKDNQLGPGVKAVHVFRWIRPRRIPAPAPRAT